MEWKESFQLRQTQETYTNDQLKDLVKKAWEIEVVERGKELGRKLTEEEKNEIKITQEFLNKYNRKGMLPTSNTFYRHFGSIVHFAKLLELPASRDKVNETYYEGNLGEYIKAIKTYIKENKDITRGELRRDIEKGKVPGVAKAVLKHHDVFDMLGIMEKKIPEISVGEEKSPDEEMLGPLREAYKLARSKVRSYRYFSDAEYDSLRKDGILKNAPTSKALKKRFGPYWGDVLKKAGLS